jgi:hypothetical protein
MRGAMVWRFLSEPIQRFMTTSRIWQKALSLSESTNARAKLPEQSSI